MKIWITPDEYASRAQARAKLSLDKTPDGYFEIPMCRVQCPSADPNADHTFAGHVEAAGWGVGGSLVGPGGARLLAPVARRLTAPLLARTQAISVRVTQGVRSLAASLKARTRHGGSAAKSADEGVEGGLNLFKWGHPTSTRPTGSRDGDYMLPLPNMGSPKVNWAQNSSRLRSVMRSGKPIYESYVDSKGNLIPTTGFLNAERNLLINRGWTYDPGAGVWSVP